MPSVVGAVLALALLLVGATGSAHAQQGPNPAPRPPAPQAAPRALPSAGVTANPIAAPAPVPAARAVPPVQQPANLSAPEAAAETAAEDPDMAPPMPALTDVHDDILGEMTETVTFDKDTLLDIARSEELGLIELMAANPGIDPWYPGTGKRLTLPTAHILPDAPRQGIVINVAELRIYYFHPEKGVLSFPIGVGKEGFSTPLGRTKVVRKQDHPTWIPTEAKRQEDPTLPAVVPPGPDNPMGEYALYLGWPTYAVHGTNQPWAVGRRVTRGCIRLYPEDIEWLFANVPVGTPVTVVDQPVKFGWRNGELYVEVAPSLTQIDQIEETHFMQPEPVTDQTDQILMVAGDARTRINWQAVEQALTERRGYPIRITAAAAAPAAATDASAQAATTAVR